jgi:hypothetical protein
MFSIQERLNSLFTEINNKIQEINNKILNEKDVDRQKLLEKELLLLQRSNNTNLKLIQFYKEKR